MSAYRQQAEQAFRDSEGARGDYGTRVVLRGILAALLALSEPPATKAPTRRTSPPSTKPDTTKGSTP